MFIHKSLTIWVCLAPRKQIGDILELHFFDTFRMAVKYHTAVSVFFFIQFNVIDCFVLFVFQF